MRNLLLILTISILIFSCEGAEGPVGPGGSAGAPGAPGAALVINVNTTWSGAVLVSQEIYVTENATLTIEPGAVVSFYPGDSEINVYGAIIAEGGPGNWIEFNNDITGIRTGFITGYNNGTLTFKYCKINRVDYISSENGLYMTNCIYKQNNWSVSAVLGYIKNCDFISNSSQSINCILTGVVDSCYIAYNNGSAIVTTSTLYNDPNVPQQYDMVTNISNPLGAPNFP